MKKLFFCASILALALASCKKAEDKAIDNGATDTIKAVTPSTETSEAAAMPDSASMMKAWQEYATPGDMHKLLASDVGSWKASMKMWTDPTKEPQVSNATVDIKMTMGGRYQEARYKGKVMGMDFEGVGTMGYNNASKKFESTWYDNSGTGLMYVSGDYDAATKSITLTGNMVDPMTKKDKKFREVYTFVDDKTRKMEMFDTDPSGNEYKSMEIELKKL